MMQAAVNKVLTVKPANVRVVEPKDENQLFDLLCLLYAENAIFEMNEQKVRGFIRNAANRQGNLIGVIDGPDGKIIGAIGMVISQFWYTDMYNLEEYFNFTHPDHRRSNNAKDLIDFAKWCSEQMGIVLNIGIISNIRTEAKIILYKKRLKMMGAFFMHNMPDEAADGGHLSGQ